MTAIIIQARMGSTRFPGKIMKELASKPVLWHVVNRCRKSKMADQVIVATTDNSEDDIVEKFCEENKILCYRGSSENVLERYYQAAKKYGVNDIARVTSDCPLIDPRIIDLCFDAFRKGKYDYSGNVLGEERSVPIGLEVEVFSFSSLEKSYQEAAEVYEKEHVTPYIWENKKGEFKIGPIVAPLSGYRADYRLTMDYPEDFETLEKIYREFYEPGNIISVPAVLKYLDRHPEVVKINAHRRQKPLK